MWKITTHGFTLQEVLILAAMNVATGDRQRQANYLAQPNAPRSTKVQEIVMAKVIEFYIPKNFRKALRTSPQPQLGKIIEFCSQTKRSA
jgi:hypothetical protein